MNLGQFLTTHSPLPSGTVVQHFAALQIGSGTGETIFASSMRIIVTVDEISIDQRPVSIQVFPEDQKAAYPLLCNTDIAITQKATATYVEQKADEIVVSRRPSHPKVIEK